jgi:hypothetical protein
MTIKKEKETVMPSVTAEKQNETVVNIPKSMLDGLVKKIEDQGKNIKMLTEVADISRLTRWQSAHKEETVSKVKISTYGLEKLG